VAGSSLFGDRVLRLASVQTTRQQQRKHQSSQQAQAGSKCPLLTLSLPALVFDGKPFALPSKLFGIIYWFSMWLLFLFPHSCGVAKRGRKYLREADSGDDGAPEPAASSTDPPRRKGGRLQRLRQNFEEEAAERDAAPVPENPDDVALTNDLKYRWAKGDLSSSAVQSLSANAQRQGARNLEKLSAAGTYGKHAKNLFRDIGNLFGHPIGAPPLDWIEIPMKGNRKTAHPIYWPHKFFQSVAHYRDDIFRSRLIGLDGAADQFWQSIAGSDYVRNHPFLPRGAWGKIIPIGMHGDGGIQQARFPIRLVVEYALIYNLSSCLLL
jgi:hypothetical protein